MTIKGWKFHKDSSEKSAKSAFSETVPLKITVKLTKMTANLIGFALILVIVEFLALLGVNWAPSEYSSWQHWVSGSALSKTSLPYSVTTLAQWSCKHPFSGSSIPCSFNSGSWSLEVLGFWPIMGVNSAGSIPGDQSWASFHSSQLPELNEQGIVLMPCAVLFCGRKLPVHFA